MSKKAAKRILSKKKHTKVPQNQSDITKELCREIRENREKKPVSVKNKKLVNDSKKQDINGKKPIRRDKNGRIMSGSGGNGGGRPKGTLSGARISEIRQSIARVEIERNNPENKRKFKTWLDHQVNKSYDETPLAIAFLSRMYPSLKAIEQITFDGDLMDETDRANLWAAYNEKRFDF